MIYLTILTVFAYIFISPIYKKWYKNMRKYDDRDKANIISCVGFGVNQANPLTI